MQQNWTLDFMANDPAMCVADATIRLPNEESDWALASGRNELGEGAGDGLRQ
jgi:hypothetical protein